MRTKAFRISTITILALLTAVAVDNGTSHKLSSLAVSSFNTAVGHLVELVDPRPEPADPPRQAAVIPAPAFTVEPPFRPGETAQASPTPGAPGIVQELELVDALPLGEPLTLESQASSSTAGQSGGASAAGGRRASAVGTGGSGAGIAGGPGASAAGENPGTASTLAREQTTETSERLSSLMDMVMAELTGDSAPVVSSGRSTGSSLAPSSDSGGDNSSVGTTLPGSKAGTSSTPSTNAPENNGKSDGGTGTVAAPPSSAPAAAPSAMEFTDPVLANLYPAPSESLSDVIAEVMPMANLIPAAFVPSSDNAPQSLFQQSSNLDLASEPQIVVNPEPATLLLFGTGLALAARQVRRSKSGNAR